MASREPQKGLALGGYECELVRPTSADMEVECPICLQMLRRPHVTSCCGKNFCNACINRIRVTSGRCPLCKHTNFTTVYNRAHNVALKQLEVYCIHRKNGCEWKGKLEMFKKHLNFDPEPEKQLEGCALVEVQCCHDGCGQSLQRCLMAMHQSEGCPQRPFTCKHCRSYKATYDDVTTNHWLVCKSYPLSCPKQCTQSTIQRQHLGKHLNKDCPLQEVECDVSYAGCTSRVLRKDMAQHVKNNLVYHVSLLAHQNQKLMSKLLEKKETIRKITENIREEMESLEQRREQEIRKLEEEMKHYLMEIEGGRFGLKAAVDVLLKDCVMDLHEKAEANARILAEPRTKQLEKLYRDALMQHEQATKRLTCQMETKQNAERRIKDLAKKQNALIRAINEQVQLVAQRQVAIIEELAQQGGHLVTRQDAVNTDLVHWIKRLQLTQDGNQKKLAEHLTEVNRKLCAQTNERQVLDQAERLAASQLLTKGDIEKIIGQVHSATEQIKLRDIATKGSIKELHQRVSVAPTRIIMPNFHQHQWKSDSWSSEEFYTHPQGYKMSLEVYANGFKSGLNTHVSFYVFLWQGEFDDRLEWPFRGNVTIQLLDQRKNKKHYTHVVDFDGDCDVNTGKGPARFIHHEKLVDYHGATYLMNGCLYFQVQVELY